jgi:hypothetical protein
MGTGQFRHVQDVRGRGLLFLVNYLNYLNSSFLGIEKIPGHPASFVRTPLFL